MLGSVLQPVLRPVIQSKPCALCGFHRSRDQGGEGTNGQIVSIKRAADGRKQGNRKIIDEKKKSTGSTTNLCGKPRRTRKERLLRFS